MGLRRRPVLGAGGPAQSPERMLQVRAKKELLQEHREVPGEGRREQLEEALPGDSAVLLPSCPPSVGLPRQTHTVSFRPGVPTPLDSQLMNE